MPAADPRGAPALGADTAAVLAEHGYDEAAIAELFETGVAGGADSSGRDER